MEPDEETLRIEERLTRLESYTREEWEEKLRNNECARDYRRLQERCDG
jgi:hypothetical protein